MKVRMEETLEDETSECNNGCESGWTMYLGQSYENPSTSLTSRKVASLQEEEDDDLSMVSDASSGPPHYHHQEVEQCFCGDGNNSFSSPRPTALVENGGAKRRRVKASGTQQLKEYKPSLSFLDDTASSPVFSFSTVSDTTKKKLSAKGLLEFSCDFSTTEVYKDGDGAEKKQPR